MSHQMGNRIRNFVSYINVLCISLIFISSNQKLVNCQNWVTNTQLVDITTDDSFVYVECAITEQVNSLYIVNGSYTDSGDIIYQHSPTTNLPWSDGRLRYDGNYLTINNSTVYDAADYWCVKNGNVMSKTTVTIKSQSCKNSGIFYNGKCYWPKKNSRTNNFYTAKSDCERDNTQLVTIQSLDFNQKVCEWIDVRYGAWIGVYDHYSNNTYQYVTGTQLDEDSWTNWNNGNMAYKYYYREGADPYNCVVIFGYNCFWWAVRCTENGRPRQYVCESKEIRHSLKVSVASNCTIGDNPYINITVTDDTQGESTTFQITLQYYNKQSILFNTVISHTDAYSVVDISDVRVVDVNDNGLRLLDLSSTNWKVTEHVYYRQYVEFSPQGVSISSTHDLPVVKEGDNITLTCNYTASNPDPTRMEFRSNINLNANSYTLASMSPNLPTLLLHDLHRRMNGVSYWCVITNRIESERSYNNVTLDVRSQPGVVVNIIHTLLNEDDGTVSIQWEAGDTGGYEQNFTITYNHNNTEQTINNNITLFNVTSSYIEVKSCNHIGCVSVSYLIVFEPEHSDPTPEEQGGDVLLDTPFDPPTDIGFQWLYLIPVPCALAVVGIIVSFVLMKKNKKSTTKKTSNNIGFTNRNDESETFVVDRKNSPCVDCGIDGPSAGLSVSIHYKQTPDINSANVQIQIQDGFDQESSSVEYENYPRLKPPKRGYEFSSLYPKNLRRQVPRDWVPAVSDEDLKYLSVEDLDLESTSDIIINNQPETEYTTIDKAATLRHNTLID